VIIKLIHPTNAKNTTSTNSWWTRIRFSIPLLLIFHFSIFNILSCGIDIEDSTPPSPPKWIKKSLPEEWPESGIDANEDGGISIEWRANLDEDITAYNIYRAEWINLKDSLSSFKFLSQIENRGNINFEYVDNSVIRGIKYYYKLLAIDDGDNSSDYSDSTYYTLLPVSVEDMAPNGANQILGEDRLLSWHYLFWIEMEDYCFTILNTDNQLVLRQLLMPRNYIGGYESWQIPDSIRLLSGTVYKWRLDIGAIYVDGKETAGSESSWATFLYLGP
jgi:hypothetical protein